MLPPEWNQSIEQGEVRVGESTRNDTSESQRFPAFSRPFLPFRPLLSSLPSVKESTLVGFRFRSRLLHVGRASGRQMEKVTAATHPPSRRALPPSRSALWRDKMEDGANPYHSWLNHARESRVPAATGSPASRVSKDGPAVRPYLLSVRA